MKVLVYQQKHSGDPDERSGVWGISGRLKRVRTWPYDAVIGIGGNGVEARENEIAYLITWIGVGPIRGEGLGTLVSFKKFAHWGRESDYTLRQLAPTLANRIYGRSRSIRKTMSFSEREEAEIHYILHVFDQMKIEQTSPAQRPRVRCRRKKRIC